MFRHLAVAVLFLSSALLISACGSSTTPQSSRYWSVVMATNSTATLTFGNGLAASAAIIPAGASVSTGSQAQLFLSNGGTTTCNLLNPGQTAITAGGVSGTITFGGLCAGQMTSNMTIALGGSTALLDASGNTIVGAGKSSTATIAAPGAVGASTGNVTY